MEREILDAAIARAHEISDLQDAIAEYPEVAQELKEKGPQLLDAVLQERVAFRHAWLVSEYAKPSRVVLAIGIVCCASSAFLAAISMCSFVSISEAREWPLAFQPFGASHLSVALISLVLTLAILGYIGWQVATSRRVVGSANYALDSAKSRMMQRLVTEAGTTLTALLNAKYADELSQIAALRNSKAPRLIEMESSGTIDSDSLKTIEDFISNHETSAVGLSGPRGVGKTTIMRRLVARNKESHLSVYIPAPVKYSPENFVRLVHRRVAEEILSGAGAEQKSPTEDKSRRVSYQRSFFGMLLFTMGILILFVNRFGGLFAVSSSDYAALLLVVFGGATYASGLTAIFESGKRRRRSSSSEEDLVELAKDALMSLGFTSKHQRTSKNVFTFSNFLRTEDQEQLELSQKEHSHPEMVSNFKDFIAKHWKVSNKRVVVAIDELDKIEDPQEAIAFINGIKDLFHVQSTHYIVSVSEDALYSFSLRGIPIRDAFDSSFDFIVPVRRLTLDESREILDGRVMHFPSELTSYCHSVSGGLPRDLIRFARQCVDIRRARSTEVPVPEVVFQVSRLKSLTVMEAATTKMGEKDQRLLRSCLQVCSALDSCANRDGYIAALESGARQLAIFHDGGRELASFFQCLATACSYFSMPLTGAEWQERKQSGQYNKVTEQIAKAFTALSVDPAEALSRLSLAHASAGFQPLRLSMPDRRLDRRARNLH
ncbi:P-loop NTPase fold protein [Streptomyces massasporeus]|uniref:P-loop NTPase fold protein n=1 Tax=Streptomyces massasporeus TaxID=67324 RepID=UPI0033310850